MDVWLIGVDLRVRDLGGGFVARRSRDESKRLRPCSSCQSFSVIYPAITAIPLISYTSTRSAS
eukprot:scaffold1381_cov111-Isochrysis_galbana.AAC.1